MELKGKLGQRSVNGLLNNSSSVNPLPLPDIMEVDSLREKRSGETTNQDCHCHGYELFQSVLEHGLSPSLNLNHNTYLNFPLVHVRRESWQAAQRNISTLPELSECTIPSCRPVSTILIMTTKCLPFEITWYDGWFLRPCCTSLLLSFC